MERALSLRKRRKGWPVNLSLLREMTRHWLQEEFPGRGYELGIFLVGEAEMTKINEEHLQHAGSTDVITFDYAGGLQEEHESSEKHTPLVGELFVCLDEARLQAERFKTSWQSELVRYIVHGVLHLAGHDDLRAAPRRKMKREEDRLVGWLEKSFNVSALGGIKKRTSPAPRTRRVAR